MELSWLDGRQIPAKMRSPPCHEDTTIAAGGDEEGIMACDKMMRPSSPVGSTTAGIWHLAPTPATSQTEKRKHEGREPGEGEWLSEEKDVNFESANAKKPVTNSIPTKRSLRANVRNLSKRRHSDKINRKMRALQELIPWSIKADTTSLLDEAIEYVKLLQLQVQMMSMSYGMVPVVLLSVPPYTPCINMGTAGNAGINSPMALFPNVLASSMMQPSANGPNLALGSLCPPIACKAETPDQFRAPPNHLDPTISLEMTQNLNQQCPAYANSYKQHLGHSYMRQPPEKDGVMIQSGAAKPKEQRRSVSSP